MKRLVLIITMMAVVFSSCTQYLERKAEEQRVKDSIIKARQDSIEEAKYRKQRVQDSIKHIQDSIRKAEHLYELMHSIKITSAWLDRPNSAGGCDANVYYKNLSNKTIKYFYWEGYPMNAVGDRVACEIRGFQTFRGQDTGPVKPGQNGGGCWSCAWYNHSARKLILTKIDITYMDGTSFSITSSELPYVWKQKK